MHSDNITVKSSLNLISIDFTNMKINQYAMLRTDQLNQCIHIGELLARLRTARRIKQSDAALRAGLSRNTVYRLEKGDPGLAVGQVLRYLDAIAPGSTLLDLLTQRDPALRELANLERRQRVRDLTADELKALDF